ncbi:uncharacterized protein BDZ99DRAFT_571050 [Mytilinidion resinicola]|uniref:CorA-like transporter domain-containing protein n=1 Tax=Mytilinidion resinicola TaxID=574789 RepID=A0A6A6YPM7_9PEZI|nr:uncharacterized protein BDZ99DRAFT_571050 [Mytilinidion resinicola]KAF2810478.1 hypothetical protein BDZ99DRAFT_571050 [Mytilinidion resinicola]
MARSSVEASEDWENYPRNLIQHSFYVDENKCNVRLTQDSERLFVPEKDSEVWVFDVGEPFKGIGNGDGEERAVELFKIKGSPQLSSFLKTRRQTVVISIRQSFSWSRLKISEEGLKRLFTNLRVHPNFLDVVHVFGEKTEPVEETFLTFFYHPIFQRPIVQIEDVPDYGGYEIGYNIKYVAGHGRPFLKDPYVIRETGIYQKFWNTSASKQGCNWVLIHASDALEERAKNLFKSPWKTACPVQFQMHVMILLFVSDTWRPFISFNEELFWKLRQRGFLTDIKGPKSTGDFEADFTDVRSLQALTDKMRQISHTLGLNIQLATQLKASINRVRQMPIPDALPLECFEEFDSHIDFFIFQQKTHSARVECLIARAQGVSTLIQNILDIRNADNNNRLNHAVHDIAEQGIKENQLIKRITRQSMLDTKSMVVIAFVSAVFLPATFIATLFGSNFFGFVSAGDHHMIAVADNVWIYIVTALGTSGLTVLISGWWWRKTRNETDQSKNDDECFM